MLLIFEDLSCANKLLTMLTGTILVRSVIIRVLAKLHLKTPVFRVSGCCVRSSFSYLNQFCDSWI